MSKAYDRVEWDFIKNMMKMLGFCNRWIELIMRCARSMSYLVVNNGIQEAEFKPTRGIKQRDPLSPYLFIICAEGFLRLLNKSKREKRIAGARVGKGELVITHLFFADDNILFRKATMNGARSMKVVINKYESISGQVVNFEKSLIYFSNNMQEDLKEQIGGYLGVRVSNNPEKYLGLPTMVGRRKKWAFIELKERFIQKSKN
ncbi:hypothetical protein J1N35_010724 [Gossypium stocksii]|uniref:Reverse transcriptase domain-containing protein n=1 Tax=Gossypium stocksii TaxID=47602 RepID=A0A9D3W0L0_9ROSI|nr:hypothetical protein J1N35_010724 [Gossypium stocksii]